MARTTLTRTIPLGSYPTLPVTADASDLIMTAADVSNKNQFVLDGPMIIVAHNTGVSARTITITSAPDALKRTGDITAYSIGAGEYYHHALIETGGWRQSDGFLYLEANNAEVKLGAIKLP